MATRIKNTCSSRIHDKNERLMRDSIEYKLKLTFESSVFCVLYFPFKDFSYLSEITENFNCCAYLHKSEIIPNGTSIFAANL